MEFDTSLTTLWRAFKTFIKGKRRTSELNAFIYNAEREIALLSKDISSGTYKHGPYKHFEVCDNKRRRVSVAYIRDRVVHRLLYDFLVARYDKTFFFDVWSCRKNKGLLGAINRAQSLLTKYPRAWVWRLDIKKFFDSVDQNILKKLISKKVFNEKFLSLTDSIIDTYSSDEGRERERERERERVKKSKKVCR